MIATIPEHKSATEEISGPIERVTFHNDESGFCVLRVRVRGHRDEITVIGSLPSVTAGEWFVAEGWWVRDKEHGLQFKAKSLKTVPPTTVEGIERYLGGGWLANCYGRADFTGAAQVNWLSLSERIRWQ